ncbi:MAG TPA: alpha/beta hydrolase [Candidatus Nitrosotenuis sp.]|jgi:pimeloyl-ACP methyl ester carboxylesterase|nr:alpha/beta hydrolase [Candidatus Nitrosotenuis sp.]
MIPISYFQTKTETLAYKYHPQVNKPTIMFLPGYHSDMYGLKAQYLEQLALENGLGYLSLDYMGHGQSSGNFIDGTIGHWAQNAQDIIHHTQANNLIVVGSSMGGWIMLLTALALPQPIKALVGIAAAPDFTEYRIWHTMNEAERQELKEKEILYIPSEYTAQGLPLTYRLIEEGRNHLLLNRPINITHPIRLLHGVLDTDVPTTHTLKLLERLTSSDVQAILIKDGDHRLSKPHHLKILGDTVQGMV